MSDSPLSSEMSDRDVDERLRTALFGEWDGARCRVCGWLIGGTSCWYDNCSMRPVPEVRADQPAPYSSDASVFEMVVLSALDARGLGPKYWRVKHRMAFDAFAHREKLIAIEAFDTVGDREAALGFLLESLPLSLRARAALTVLTEQVE